MAIEYVVPSYSGGSFVTNPSYATDGDVNTYALVQANDVGQMSFYTPNVPPYSGTLSWEIDAEISIVGSPDVAFSVYTNDGPYPVGPPSYSSTVTLVRTTLSVLMNNSSYVSDYHSTTIEVNRGWPPATVSAKVYDIKFKIVTFDPPSTPTLTSCVASTKEAPKNALTWTA